MNYSFSAFTVNFFQSFAGVTSNPSAVYAIITGSMMWPVLLTWTSAGFLVGAISKGLKRSLITGAVLFAIVLLLILIFSLFAGVNVGEALTTAFLNTFGELITAAICFFPLVCLGGAVSGPDITA